MSKTSKKYFKIAKIRTNQKIFNGNSSEINDILSKNKIKNIDFCITSPPYWNVLNRSTGGFKNKREEKKLDYNYSKKEKLILCIAYQPIHAMMKM